MAFHSRVPLPYVGAFLLLMALIVHVLRVSRRPISKLPGPWISKWTDVVTRYYWLRGIKPEYVHRLHEQYGPLVRLGPNEISTCDISAVKEMYSFKGEYLKSDFYPRLVGSQLKHIFSSIDVQTHRLHRRLLSGPMAESSLKSVEPVVRAKAELAIQRMANEMEAKGVVDVFKWCLFYTTDTIGQLSFGESFRMLEIGQENGYIKDLQKNSMLSGLRAELPELAALAKYIPLPLFREIAPIGDRLEKYSRESIQRYERVLSTDPDAPPCLFAKVLQAGEDGGLSKHEIISNAQVYIIAGSDTTSNTLTYLLWSVCRNPQIQQRLTKELTELLPSGWNSDHLKELPYLNMVIEETLRLFPQVPGSLPRVIPPSGAVITGHFVPPNVITGAQAYTMHRDSEAFPAAEIFNPSRWEAPTKAMKESFVPFGGGSRVCLGLHLARIELRLGAALFFLKFPNARISTRDGMCDADMEPEMYFLMAPKGNRCLMELS